MRPALPLFRPRAQSFAAVTLALSALLLGPGAVAAQWKWVDAQGVVHYSDQPPPLTVPARSILQRPAQATVPPQPQAPAPADAKVQTGGDLEKKIAEKKSAEQAAQEQAKLRQQQEQALLNQQNCVQAQRQLQILDSGQRMVQIDAQGQRVVMDDALRAQQRAQALALIAQYCH
ncbi:MAG: DUF4124 domain-containing protein [Thiomonas sp.]